MSNVTIATNQSAKTTTVSFTVTGESGTTGFGNITIPKSAVPYGTTPTIYIDGQPAQNQGYTQDSQQLLRMVHNPIQHTPNINRVHRKVFNSRVSVVSNLATVHRICSLCCSCACIKENARKAKVERNISEEIDLLEPYAPQLTCLLRGHHYGKEYEKRIKTKVKTNCSFKHGSYLQYFAASSM